MYILIQIKQCILVEEVANIYQCCAFPLNCVQRTKCIVYAFPQILPYFVNDVFRHWPGVPGLLLTGLFGAALR